MLINRHVNAVLFLSFLQPATMALADYPPARTDRGADIYLKYCAGCHGFNGRAAYRYAPSFSLGERMQKNDRELLQNVLNGSKGMAPWSHKLPVQDLLDAIAYLRLMHTRYMNGQAPRQKPLPDIYYLFNPVGEMDIDWVQGN